MSQRRNSLFATGTQYLIVSVIEPIYFFIYIKPTPKKITLLELKKNQKKAAPKL